MDFTNNISEQLFDAGEAFSQQYSLPLPYKTYENEYDTIHDTVEVGTYVCAGSQDALIVRPSDTDSGAKYPLLSFGHGVTVGGKKIRYYNTYFDRVASSGFIIIANESATTNWCLQEDDDMMASVDWIKTSSYNDMIDWSVPLGIHGHSMGGAATQLWASTPDKVTQYNVGAAVMLHPASIIGGPYVPVIPSFYTTGSTDDMVPPGRVLDKYDMTTGVDKAFAEKEGVGHSWIATSDEQWSTYAVYFFKCYLLNDDNSCIGIYGSSTADPCSLCDCPTCVMTQCEHERQPTITLH